MELSKGHELLSIGNQKKKKPDWCINLAILQDTIMGKDCYIEALLDILHIIYMIYICVIYYILYMYITEKECNL